MSTLSTKNWAKEVFEDSVDCARSDAVDVMSPVADVMAEQLLFVCLSVVYSLLFPSMRFRAISVQRVLSVYLKIKGRRHSGTK